MAGGIGTLIAGLGGLIVLLNMDGAMGKGIILGCLMAVCGILLRIEQAISDRAISDRATSDSSTD